MTDDAGASRNPRPAAGGPITALHIDTQRGWRGGERQVLWLAEGLARAGHRSIIAARPGEPLAERAMSGGLRVVPLAPLFAMDPAAIGDLRRAIAAMSVDIVHAHTSHGVTLGALATIRSRAAFVVTRRVAIRPSAGPITRWKYRRASAVIAISEAAARGLVERGIPRERIEIIPSGVDLDRSIVPATPGILGVLGVPAGAPLVVQVGALEVQKDPLTFVRAIAAARRRVPRLHAIMVGSGRLQAAVESERTALGLESALHLAGYRSDADAILAAADVATLSSREEGLGTVLLDALALRRPVAATAGGGIPEIIEDGVSGLLAPVGDAEVLGREIARLLTDRALAARVAAAGRERVAAFSVARTVDRTAAVYERVLRSG
jgi:glycosyltransferase involved in cell wall biosynthesis